MLDDSTYIIGFTPSKMSIKITSSFPDQPLTSCVFYKISFPRSLHLSYHTLSVATTMTRNSNSWLQNHKEMKQIWSFHLEKLDDEKKILFPMYLDTRISQSLENSQRRKLMMFKSWKTHVDQNLEPQKLCKRKSSTFQFQIVLNVKI